jgi:hypothetical protein
MGARDRLVRRVRLRAESEEAVRHMLPRLEDALRCASMPDDSVRVLVVRKLALGSIRHDCSAQQLSGLIEQRVAELGAQWQDGDRAEASASDFVQFRSPLAARIALMRRLVRGEACSAWYWPLAVKEFHSRDSLQVTVRRLAGDIAQWPEAAVALPAWAAAVVRAGGLELLAASFSPVEGAALLQWAGISLVQGLRPQATDVVAAGRATPGHGNADAPPWLFELLQVAGLPTQERSGRKSGADSGTDEGVAAVGLVARAAPEWLAPCGKSKPPVSDGARVGRGPAVQAHRTDPPDALAQRTQSARSGAGRAPDRTSVRASAAGDATGREDTANAAPAAEAQTPLAWLAPTECGGLLFLLPVLQSLGLPPWCGDDRASAAMARRILAAALTRLGVAAEDPAWQITQASHADLPAVCADAPACWTDSTLRPPASQLPVALPQALVAASSGDEQAQIWLSAVRRCLRRRAGIGLASLLLRPARLDWSATHLDMHFYLEDVDLRVRRAGLDIDPGWLPWFGRVVAFHYRERRV